MCGLERSRPEFTVQMASKVPAGNCRGLLPTYSGFAIDVAVKHSSASPRILPTDDKECIMFATRLEPASLERK